MVTDAVGEIIDDRASQFIHKMTRVNGVRLSIAGHRRISAHVVRRNLQQEAIISMDDGKIGTDGNASCERAVSRGSQDRLGIGTVPMARCFATPSGKTDWQVAAGPQGKSPSAPRPRQDSLEIQWGKIEAAWVHIFQ